MPRTHSPCNLDQSVPEHLSRSITPIQCYHEDEEEMRREGGLSERSGMKQVRARRKKRRVREANQQSLG